MLRWLKINRYRNVVPGTELAFSEGHHVLLGPNGGGKTTLLELIAAVLRGDFSGLADEEFSIEYRISRSGFRLDVALSHIRTMSQNPSPAPVWSNTLAATVRQGEGEGESSVDFADNKILVNGIKAGGYRVDITGIRLHRNLINAYKVSAAAGTVRPPDFTSDGAVRFDEALVFFSFMRGNGAMDGQPASLSLSVQTQAPRRVLWGAFHSLLSKAYSSFSNAVLKTDDVDRITVPLSDLGFLGDAVELMGFQSGTYRAELERQERMDKEERLTYERFQFRFVRRDGTMVLDEHLSFGQKRLLAFLFYAWANDGPIVADELVDGMHYRWIEHCLKTIRGRQAFLSSQNPLLMDFIGFDSAEKVQQTFVICDVEESDGRERMRWRNLTADEAGDFFNAYEVGIQHVSEILRDKGLW